MIISDLPKIMLVCLILTIIIEILTGIICGIRSKKDIINILLVNVLTNPIVVSLPFYMMLRYGLKARYTAMIVLEILTVFVEGLVYSKVLEYKKIKPFLIALILNVSSYFIGEVINKFNVTMFLSNNLIIFLLIIVVLLIGLFVIIKLKNRRNKNEKI